MFRFPRLMLVLLGAGLLAVACTSVPAEELSVPLPTTTAEVTTTTTTTTTEAPRIIDFTGAIAIGGREDLLIVQPDGDLLTSSPPEVDGVAMQPAWSRDGERAVAFLANTTGGNVTVVAEDRSWVHPARRGYFFFSWSGDGQYIAALGPGPEGTTLDILTAEGELATQQSLDTQSFYLAWEPGGDDLVIHRNDSLELIRDPLDLETIEPLGEPGQSFLAPAWIPETREILIVDDADGGRLIRLDVDSGARDDLGAVGGGAGLTVSPDGSRLFLTHSGPNVEFSDDITISNPLVQDDDLAITEIVVLETGLRIPINNQISLWAEWSNDGAGLVFLQPASGTELTWWLLDESGIRELVTIEQISPVFFRNYVFFAWQFVESPRIWSPNGDAIVYAAVVDGEPQVVVHPFNGEPMPIASGDVAFWAPELPGGGGSPA